MTLAMFFGATSDPTFHQNQERLKRLSWEMIAYQGRPGIIEEDVARKARQRHPEADSKTKPVQLRLFYRRRSQKWQLGERVR